jgi:TonB family protein
MGLIAAVAAIVLLGGVGAAYYMMNKAKPATSQIAAAKPAPAPAKAQIAAPALISSTPVTSTPVAATTGTVDPAAQKKAFEQAVEQKLQEEMMKLQSEYTKSLKQQQSKNAPVQTASLAAPPVPASVEEPSAAQLDSKRLAAGQTTTVTQQPAPAVAQPVVEQPAPAPAPIVPTVQEGDVIDFTELDNPPTPLGSIHADYPRLAMQQKAKATVVVSALISERGEVLDVKILKGDARFGFNDAAIRAIRTVRFSAPTKSGKHVKTWRPQTFVFNPS